MRDKPRRPRGPSPAPDADVPARSGTHPGESDLSQASARRVGESLRGAVRDRHDGSKWQTERGPLSVTGPKFTNWHGGQGGGGAIDLLIHLAEVDVGTAVRWLEQHLAASHPAASPPTAAASGRQPTAPQGHSWLRLPVPKDHLLGRVRHCLTGRRDLSSTLIEPLIQSGKLYADSRGNAVFLLVAGKAQRPVGAELRVLGPPYRQSAP